VRTFRQAKEPQAEDIDAILDVRGVSAGYTQDTKVVKAIDLRVTRRKTIAVVGESGSGKTSLARVITGLLPPTEGQIIFDGQVLAPDLQSRDRESLRRLQMIFQMPDVALNPRQKVRKILGRPLAFYFGMKGIESEKRIRALLEMIELPRRYIERFPSELSGGEKQRVCIARALAAQPDLIICDEVTSALDQLVAEEILKLLDRLQNELGVSYLFITHDLATVKAIADEIVVMLQGRIVEQGPKKQILVPPWHEYTELLLSSVPEMDPDWLDHLLAERQAEAQ
jgi:peptide/nickel transport system ATP-binding protein